MNMSEPNIARTQSMALQAATPLHKPFAEFKYSLPSVVDMMSPFVDHLMRLIKTFRIADGTEIDIEVALREALLNAVIHGNHEDPHKHVYLTLFCVADGEVSIMIRDEGAGFESDSVPDPTASENRMSTHGRGIYLMRALMDEVSFEQGGTVVYMRKSPSSPSYRPQ